MTVTPPAQSICADLRVEFFKRGITHAIASQRTGISPSAISRRLSGEVQPTIDQIARLADAAGLDVRVELLERTS